MPKSKHVAVLFKSLTLFRQITVDECIYVFYAVAVDNPLSIILLNVYVCVPLKLGLTSMFDYEYVLFFQVSCFVLCFEEMDNSLFELSMLNRAGLIYTFVSYFLVHSLCKININCFIMNYSMTWQCLDINIM